MSRKGTRKVPKRKILQMLAARGNKKAIRELAQLNRSETKQTAQELKKLNKGQ